MGISGQAGQDASGPIALEGGTITVLPIGLQLSYQLRLRMRLRKRFKASERSTGSGVLVRAWLAVVRQRLACEECVVYLPLWWSV